MVMEIENIISVGIGQIVGNPMLLGFLAFFFIVGFAVAVRLGEEALLLILIPAFFLIFEFIPALRIITAIIIGIVIFILLMRIFRR